MTKISATIVADSLGPNGDRITSMLVTFPRFILAELNTHRMLSKNSASSRAIPFNKMVESVQNTPFIPIAWQKEHNGMQGSEYLDILNSHIVKEHWLKARDNAVLQATLLNRYNVTKQLANRLLEPFMYHTVLITATEWENFFKLRCPQYVGKNKTWRSWKEMIKEAEQDTNLSVQDFEKLRKATLLDKLKSNAGMAEIHMMALAEAIWDAMQESTPKQLKGGEWHIPFGDKIVVSNRELTKIKISTAMCARTSYTTIGDEKEFTLEQQVALHDRLINQVPLHASPMEHCARAMTLEEYNRYIKGELHKDTHAFDYPYPKEGSHGWCNNYRGFISYRYLLENP
jgi:thymidylate synthase ThyX